MSAVLTRLATAALVGVLGAGAALAQSPAPAPTAGQTVPLYSNLGTTTMYARLDTLGTAVTVAGSGAAAFHALRDVYGDLKVPVTDADSAAGWLGTLRVIRTYALGRFALSSVLDCGTGMSGPVADEARIQMAVVTFVLPVGADSTSVRTAVVAQAQSLEGAEGRRALCSSNGRLEDWIRSRLVERLARR